MDAAMSPPWRRPPTMAAALEAEHQDVFEEARGAFPRAERQQVKKEGAKAATGEAEDGKRIDMVDGSGYLRLAKRLVSKVPMRRVAKMQPVRRPADGARDDEVLIKESPLQQGETGAAAQNLRLRPNGNFTREWATYHRTGMGRLHPVH